MAQHRHRLVPAVALLVAGFAFGQEVPAPAPPAPEKPAAEAAAATQESDDFTKAVFFGKKFFDIKDYTSAYDQFAKADALRPDQPAVLYDMALVLAKAGRYSESQVKADRYLQLFPNGAEKALVAKLQLELEFQRELQKKRQADQEYVDLFNRATFQYSKNELDSALQLFQQAEQQHPTDAAAVFNQARIFEKQGDYTKAVERYRRFAELESDPEQKAGVDQKLFALNNELEDMKTKLVCSFCGLKLPNGATWCPRCWHGPYLVKSGVWNSRVCAPGASATRTTYFSDGRFNKNDSLPCLYPEGTMLDTLRYTPARQHAIQEARKAEGWKYNGDVIQGWADKGGNEVRYIQGADTLERIVSPGGGELLTYVSHPGGEGIWLLDREDLIVDAQKYTARYTYDADGRVARETVDYENTAACNHLITETADYTYTNDQLTAVKLHGGYDGYTPEGAPQTSWDAQVAYSYDENARVLKEELAVTSMAKTYQQKPVGALRDEVGSLYMGMRPKRPIENILRVGDVCGTAGTLLLGNPIDLRPFYLMSPNLAIALQPGVTKATVSFTY